MFALGYPVLDPFPVRGVGDRSPLPIRLLITCAAVIVHTGLGKNVEVDLKCVKSHLHVYICTYTQHLSFFPLALCSVVWEMLVGAYLSVHGNSAWGIRPSLCSYRMAEVRLGIPLFIYNYS